MLQATVKIAAEGESDASFHEPSPSDDKKPPLGWIILKVTHLVYLSFTRAAEGWCQRGFYRDLPLLLYRGLGGRERGLYLHSMPDE